MKRPSRQSAQHIKSMHSRLLMIRFVVFELCRELVDYSIPADIPCKELLESKTRERKAFIGDEAQQSLPNASIKRTSHNSFSENGRARKRKKQLSIGILF